MPRCHCLGRVVLAQECGLPSWSLSPEILTAAQVEMHLQEGVRGRSAVRAGEDWKVAGAEFSEELLHAVCLAIVWNAFLEIRPQVRGLWDVPGGALPPSLPPCLTQAPLQGANVDFWLI